MTTRDAVKHALLETGGGTIFEVPDYVSRFGPANPDRLNPIDPGRVVYSSDSGSPAPVEAKPEQPASAKEYAHVHRQVPPERQKGSSRKGRLRIPITALQIVTRMASGETIDAIANEQRCSPELLWRRIKLAGLKTPPKKCALCGEPTGKRSNAKYCAPCAAGMSHHRAVK